MLRTLLCVWLLNFDTLECSFFPAQGDSLIIPLYCLVIGITKLMDRKQALLNSAMAPLPPRAMFVFDVHKCFLLELDAADRSFVRSIDWLIDWLISGILEKFSSFLFLRIFQARYFSSCRPILPPARRSRATFLPVAWNLYFDRERKVAVGNDVRTKYFPPKFFFPFFILMFFMLRDSSL